MRSRSVRLDCSLVLSIWLLCTGCAEQRDSEEIRESGSLSWVTIHDSSRSVPGVNLDLFQRRIPTLFDNSGRLLHQWPGARVKSRVRLLPDGSLLGLGLGPAVFEYSWEGELTWSHRFDGELPHHDVIRLRNGNVLVITKRDGSSTDDLVELDPESDEVWRWRSDEHLQRLLANQPQRGDQNLTHFNSVQELPVNRWFDAGDARFAPGNLLVSARNLNAIFVIDRQSDAVTWTFSDQLDMQHEALMVDASLPGAGSIYVLSNGTRNRYTDRQSTVFAIDPSTDHVLWKLDDETFFTPTGGVQQPLAGGNVLVTSTRGGRIFEVDRSGNLVWEWVPPFDPTRARRYSWNHAPQLAAFAGREQLDVVPPPGYRFVERRVYRFAHRRDIEQRVVAGERRRVLKRLKQCREILLPQLAQVDLGFGFASRSSSDWSLRFVRRTEDSADEVLFEERLAAEPRASWHTTSVDLSHYGLQRIELCVAAEPAAESTTQQAGAFVWGVPLIRPGDGFYAAPHPWLGTTEERELSAEEQAARRRHLRTMGYVD